MDGGVGLARDPLALGGWNRVDWNQHFHGYQEYHTVIYKVNRGMMIKGGRAQIVN